jgi:hypothetical protein
LLVPETYAVSGSLEDIRRALALEILGLKFLKHGEYSAEGSKGGLVYGKHLEQEEANWYIWVSRLNCQRKTEMVEEMMQTRLGISGVALVLSAGLSVQTAAACPQQAVKAAVEKWATVFADNNPDTIMALYSKDAVLWGTLSPTVRSDPGALKAYFVGAFQALPKATVKFGDQLIRVYGDTAVNTGYYTFSYTKDGETKSIPARYSLTFVKDGNDCKIVDHHSSTVPPPPR